MLRYDGSVPANPHDPGRRSQPRAFRRRYLAIGFLGLWPLIACEAGPPKFDGRTSEEPRPVSRVAVDGRVADVEEGNAREKFAAGATDGRQDGDSSSPAPGTTASSSSDRSSSASGPSAGSGEAGAPAVAGGDDGRPAPSANSEPELEPPGPRVERWGTERFPYPDQVRGLYLNAWAAGSSNRSEALIELARRTEINTFVIDIKDATGFISHRTEIPVAHEIGATEEVRIRDLPGLLSRLEEEGIYPIARIVIVKDPLLIAARPELAVQDTAGGVWVDSSDIIWLNPFHRDVWAYHLDIAREVAAMGFPEIQWDYVRFPDAPRADLERAVFEGSDGRTKAAGIRAFLNHARGELAELGVLSTADVFGVTTSSARDVGIGQVWESFIDVVDAALPMVYPSHYWQGSFGFETPNAYPYEIVHRALRDAVRRSQAVEGAGRTRPYLQDFSLGQPQYGAPEVRAQIQATYDAGIEEWVLWHPGARYTEEALEPVDGFEEPPLMRVAGGIHPVARRHAVLDSVRVAREATEVRQRALRDSLNALPVDTVPAQSGDVPGRMLPPDTVAAPAGDSLQSGGPRPESR